MVNPDSPAFNFSEKIGLVIGKRIRYTTYLYRKFNNLT